MLWHERVLDSRPGEVGELMADNAIPLKPLLVRLGTAAGLIGLYLGAAAVFRVNPPGAAILVGGILLLSFSLFVLWTGPRVALNRAFFYYGVSATSYLVLVSLLHLATAIGIERVRGAVWILRNGLLMVPATMMLFTVRFVGDRSRILRALVWGSFLSMAPFLILNLSGRYVVEYEVLQGARTFIPSGDLTWYRVAAVLTVGWAVVSFGIVLRQCFRPGQRPRRTQFVFYLAAWAAGTCYALLGYLPAFDRHWFPGHVGLAWALVAMALGFGVVRFNLFDIKVVVRRTLPYAVGTALLGVLYAACLMGLEAMGARLDVLPRGSQWVIFLLLVGLAFQPVLELLQAGLDRIFFRTEAEIDRFLASAGARYHHAVTRSDLAHMLAGDACEVLKLKGAAVLWGTGQIESTASEPREPAWSQVLGLPIPDVAPRGQVFAVDSSGIPEFGAASTALADGLAKASAKAVLVFTGTETHGILACREKLSDLDFTPRDRTFLAALATHAGAVLARLDAHREAEAAHRLTEAVFESMTNAVAIIGQDGKVLGCNGAFAKAFGASEGQTVPAPAMKMVLAAIDGIPREIETPHGCFLMTVRGLQSQGVTLAVFTDITELRRLQETDRRRAELAEIGSTVSAINHEIGNILTPLIYNLGKVAQATRPDEAAQAIAVARDRAVAMERLSRELREFYREPQLSLRKTALRPVVESTLADLRSAAGGAWVAPALAGMEIEVQADIQKLKQVLLNIAKNAWEAMEKCPAKDWSIIAARQDGKAVIRVQDCGPGIPAELVKSLFRPFFTTKKERGTGLGLAVARRIAEAHAAEISINSTPGRGTEVILCWPLAN